jgi:uncharacterized protein
MIPFLLCGCDSWFYYPTRGECVHSISDRLGSGIVFSSSDGGSVAGRFVVARGECFGTVVYCYGYDGNLARHLSDIEWLPDAGFNVLAFDYRGYGLTEGVPTRSGTVDDAVAAIDAALRRDPEHTVVYGHSLGGAVGIVAAARRPAVRAVVAEATFPTYRSAAQARVPFLSFLIPLLVSVELDPVAVLRDLPPRPILVTHGAADVAVPTRLGRELYARAAEPKELWVMDRGTHAQPWGAGLREYRARLVAFLRSAIAR